MTTGGRSYPIVAPPWVFYGIPFAPRGLWIRSGLCTAQVACPCCGAEKWEPCKRARYEGDKIVFGSHYGETHAERDKAAKEVPSAGIEIFVRGLGDTGPPGGGYKISLALPPTVEDNHGD